ncbi:MAG: Tol-Pal system protein TolB [Polynucleobacter sp.]|nr:MAG: Tol-Pal system protein TolB [Polynucleobacter sp.]
MTTKHLFKKFSIALSSLVATWTMMVLPAQAQMNIEISGVGQSLFPIAVMRFTGENQLPTKVTDVVRSDLARSGAMRNVESGGAELGWDAKPDYKSWAARGADALAVGSVTRTSDGRYEIRYRLYDIRKNESLGGLVITVSADELRLAGHKIADDIIQKILGERGVFSTRLSYVIRSGKTHRLVISDSDGENAKPALASNEPIISPSWSPDGKKVAYVSFESRKPVVYVHELATGRRTVLSNQKGNNSAPTWSVDGRYLALALSKDGNTQIYKINANGTGLVRLSRSQSIDTEPQWSPDGQSIYFTSDRSGSPQIYRMSVEGEAQGGAQRITFKHGFVTSPRISPDGKNIVYIARVGGAYRLHLQDLTTGEVTPLSDGNRDETPTFAANGRYVLYAARSGGKPVLMAVSIDGKNKQVLSLPGADVREPAWGPFMD